MIYHNINSFDKTNGFHNRIISKILKKENVLRYNKNINFNPDDIFEFGGLISFWEFLKFKKKGLKNFHFQDSRFRFHFTRLKFRFSINDLIRLPYFYLLENLYTFLVNTYYINYPDTYHLLKKSHISIDLPVKKNRIHKISKSLNAPFNFFFLGNFNYEPNLNSFKELSKKNFQFKLNIYGANTNLISNGLNNSNIKINGYLDSYDSLPNNSIFINFVAYGSGYKSKIINCISKNIPVIGMYEAVDGSKCKNIYWNNFKSIDKLLLFVDSINKLDSLEYNFEIKYE